MASHYSRGRAAEWRLRKALADDGWTVIRAAGSKGPWDLVAFPRSDFGNQRILALQVKTTASQKTAQALLRGFEPHFSDTWESQLWVRTRGQWQTVYHDPSTRRAVTRLIDDKGRGVDTE